MFSILLLTYCDLQSDENKDFRSDCVLYFKTLFVTHIFAA